MSVSTCSLSVAKDSSATWRRRNPSKEKGFVTTATVNHAQAAGDIAHNRRGTTARTTAHAGGDEHQVRAFQGLSDLLFGQPRRLGAAGRVATGAAARECAHRRARA